MSRLPIFSQPRQCEAGPRSDRPTRGAPRLSPQNLTPWRAGVPMRGTWSRPEPPPENPGYPGLGTECGKRRDDSSLYESGVDPQSGILTVIWTRRSGATPSDPGKPAKCWNLNLGMVRHSYKYQDAPLKSRRVKSVLGRHPCVRRYLLSALTFPPSQIACAFFGCRVPSTRRCGGFSGARVLTPGLIPVLSKNGKSAAGLA